jgi:hydrogenase maturation factor HypE
MKAILTGLAGLVCVCLISQVASGFEPKISLSNTSLVVLLDCDSGYLVKNCGNSQGTIKQTKGYAINLKESLSMDSDKNKDTKPTKAKETKQTKTKEKKPDTKKAKAKDLKKKFEKVMEKSQTKKKPATPSKQSTQKTKHDTAKNSIGNIR